MRQTFAKGNIPTKLIFINVGIFILIGLIRIVGTLFQIGGFDWIHYLQMPSSFSLFFYRPWTLITYMFLHADLLHILFNMLWLYWFGRIFLIYFNERQFGGLYISGGIFGALFFLIAYNIFPYFRNMAGVSYLMGASAAVMAIVFAVSFYKKDHEINLLFIGRVKLIYLALFAFMIDLLSIVSANAGGHIAHIGGALFGILFATQFQKGKDLTVSVNRLIDRIINWKNRRPARMKVVYRKQETDAEYNMRKRKEADTLDEILDKLKQSGYQSLSAEEKKTLFDASKK
ncbi:MAG: rhomboid family intramembrane serine protease [Tannerella sp.]|jgi:membrane associated rhomboid family serine protease|nr:rhomboid family intramembrane serine protease [Tannerella sp.]